MKTIINFCLITFSNSIWKNKKIVLLLFVPLLFFKGYSQTRLCSEFEADQKAEIENPDAQKAKVQLEAFTNQFIQNNQKSETTYIIPVVFHVLHNYGSENISKAQILDALRIMNEDYKKSNPDTSDIVTDFIGIAANSHIEFRLAKIDPNGNCTDGIVRVATSLTYNADDNSKNESPSWDRTKYLNVWTCSSIGSGAAGYSYYPSNVAGAWGVGVDGVLILSSYIGSIGTGNAYTSRALTHEVGHWLNLAHTWGNSNQPGVASNCGIDDGVADTPNTIGHLSCDLNANSCGFHDNVQNYMEYSYCSRMFTEGQKARMQAALNSSISGRNNLWSPSNLIATGANDSAVSQICIPVSDFSNNQSFGCNSLSVHYYQQVWNTDSITSIQWSFPGGTPSTSIDQNPIINYNAAGIYSATLTVTNSAGNDTLTKTNIIQVLNTSAGESLPWIESFENSSFPISASDPNKDWTIKGSSNSGWLRIPNVGYSGVASVAVTNISNISGQTSELYSPNVIFAGNNPSNSLTFRMAYAQKAAANDDKLEVYFSYNCGQSWVSKYSKSGAALSTNGGNIVNYFTPDTSQWRKETLILSSMFNTKPNFRVKFVVTSGAGNRIFIDDINMETVTSTNFEPLTISNNLNIYPNPVTSESYVSFDLNNTSIVNILVSNVLGQRIGSFNNNFKPGNYNLSLQEILKTELPKGMFFFSIAIDGKAQTLKLIKE